jgi:hypothetical protein
MLLRTPWLFGFGLLLLSAPAQAAPCDHSCRQSAESQSGADHDDSSMHLEPPRLRGRRYALRASVAGPSTELADLTEKPKKAKKGSHPLGPSENDDLASSDPGKVGRTPSTPEPFQSAIPEPTAIVLFGTGLLFAQAANRRHRRV